MFPKVLTTLHLCVLAVAFPAPPPAPLDSTGEPEFATDVEITSEVVLTTALEVTMDGDSATYPQQTTNPETTTDVYEGSTHTFEFSTDFKMAISSFVDEASEAKDQISTSMKAMSL
jgi:hypothetical protein